MMKRLTIALREILAAADRTSPYLAALQFNAPLTREMLRSAR